MDPFQLCSEEKKQDANNSNPPAAFSAGREQYDENKIHAIPLFILDLFCFHAVNLS